MESQLREPHPQFRTPTQRDHSGTRLDDEQEEKKQKAAADFSHIKGWGADLDHKNRPAYPMERKPPRLEGLHWHDIEDQPIKQKIYHSIERPGVTPVFGTSTPPTGVSGRIRDVAYGFTENDLRHWLLLLFADRVNVVEGILHDFSRGHVPNIFAEMGWKAELKHKPSRLALKVAVTATVIGLSFRLLTRRKARPNRY